MISSPTCLTISGASPSVGSSIMISSGSPISVRQMVSICFSPPESTPAAVSARAFRLGNISSMSSSRQRPSLWVSLLPEQEILPHRETWEDVAVLGHIAEAQPGDAIARQPGDVAALEADDADRRDLAHDGLDGRRAADAVAAEQADHLAGGDIEVDALQDVALAVVGVEIAHLEHQCASSPR